MQATGITVDRLAVAGLGFPRIGARRELKFAVEAYWRGESSAETLQETARMLRERHWRAQATRGVDCVPVNDFSLYDQVLDMLVALGATPSRFGSGKVDLPRYFAMARGGGGEPAMEMTKWFDTNYHYLVPEWSADLPFAIDPSKLLQEWQEARALGLNARPVLIGPVTLLALGKPVDGSDPAALLPRLLQAYRALLDALHAAGAEWVQIDEPLLVTDLDAATRARFATAYGSGRGAGPAAAGELFR
jgi:methionine synthase (B12-independent) (EC 2.1.1.14)